MAIPRESCVWTFSQHFFAFLAKNKLGRIINSKSLNDQSQFKEASFNLDFLSEVKAAY
jgi:hypothetical protein